MGRNTVRQEGGSFIVNEGTYRALVYYLRCKPKNGDKRGAPYGVIVALDKDHVGWSVCNTLDPWNKKRARAMAAGRATRGYEYWAEKFSRWIARERPPVERWAAVLKAIQQMRGWSIDAEKRKMIPRTERSALPEPSDFPSAL